MRFSEPRPPLGQPDRAISGGEFKRSNIELAADCPQPGEREPRPLRECGAGDKMPPEIKGDGPQRRRSRKSGVRLALASIDGRRGRRIAAIDIARGVAIVAMVVYHTAFDLSAARLIATDVAGDFAWKIFARLIAGSFMFLVGVSLVLAMERGMDWPSFFRRLALVAGGAALVTLSTWWFDARTFVFFGILHAIALTSVLALPFLRLPSAVVAIAAVFFLALPWFFTDPVFDTPALWWVGLQTVPPVSVDYVPVFPWFGAVLAGIVGGRFVAASRARLAAWRPQGTPWRWLDVAGRWSLLIYLVHQPLIVGVISLAANVLPPNEPVARSNFMGECRAGCGEDRDAGTCEGFCGCMFDGLWGTELFDMNTFEEMSPAQRETFDGLFLACSPAPEGLTQVE